MPYKFDTLKLKVGRNNSRRIKLNEEQREEIKELYGKISQRKLAKMFNVSRSLIIFIGVPEIYELSKERRRNTHYYNKDKHRVYMKKYRLHKKELFGITRNVNNSPRFVA